MGRRAPCSRSGSRATRPGCCRPCWCGSAARRAHRGPRTTACSARYAAWEAARALAPCARTRWSAGAARRSSTASPRRFRARGRGRPRPASLPPVEAVDPDHSLQDERQEREDFLPEAHEEETRHPAAGAVVRHDVLPIRQVLLPVIQLGRALFEHIPEGVAVVEILQRPARVEQQPLMGNVLKKSSTELY